MNESLEKVLTWANQNSFSINANKSHAIFISKKEFSIIPPVAFGNEIISYCDFVKSLGITINKSLSWDDHIEKVCSEINNGVHMLRQTQNFTPLATRKLLAQAQLLP